MDIIQTPIDPEIGDEEGFARAELLQEVMAQVNASLHLCARRLIEAAQGVGCRALHRGSESAARLAGAREVGRVEPA